MKFYDVEQNSDPWHALRAGRLTSSKLPTVMANLGKSFGDPAKKYAVAVAVEQITGQPMPSGYQNEHMVRGHEQEPLARMLYEEEFFCNVENGGFFGADFVGCSPDGLVSDDGVIEVKSVIPSVHFANIKRQGLDPAYKWQCIGNLKFTGRKWLDFVSYCADFPEGKKLYRHRIFANELQDEFDTIDARVEEFEGLVLRTKKLILNANYL